MNTSLHTYQPLCKDSLGTFEHYCLEKHRIEMCLEIELEILRRDQLIFNQTKRICPKCSNTLHSHGKANPCTFLATCGEITVRLRRLRCASCGHILIPASQLLPDNGVSANLAERICDLASKMSYSKAADSLFIQHGIFMSTTALWSCVQNEAHKIDDIIEVEANKLFENGEIPNCVDLKGALPLIIGIDGGFVRKWKQKSSSFEIKCATLATGASSGPGNKRHLNNRLGYAAQCSVDEFRKRISLLAIKSGYLTASVRIFVSDGAYWISKMIADYFPNAIHILDMFHLKNKIRNLFGFNTDTDTMFFRDNILAICDTYDPSAIYNAISSWTPLESSKLSLKNDLLLYVKNNSLAISNHRHVSIHGSGWIEKGVDLMISRRLKNRGMAWTIPGSSNMIPFSILQYNKQWFSYWVSRKGFSSSLSCFPT